LTHAPGGREFWCGWAQIVKETASFPIPSTCVVVGGSISTQPPTPTAMMISFAVVPSSHVPYLQRSRRLCRGAA
jgi:hypothetical protein